MDVSPAASCDRLVPLRRRCGAAERSRGGLWSSGTADSPADTEISQKYRVTYLNRLHTAAVVAKLAMKNKNDFRNTRTLLSELAGPLSS